MAEAELPRDEWEALAAECALGVLDGDDRARAPRLHLADAAFAAEVAAWQTRFGALFAEVAEVPPPDGLWRAIAARLDGGDPARLTGRLRRWRFGAIGASAVAAGLALTLVLRGTPEPERVPVRVPVVEQPGPMAVAQLSGETENAPLVAARYEEKGGTLHISANRVTPGAGRAPELWVIPGDGKPRSLGLMPAEGRSQITVPETERRFMQAGSVLAITYERPEGVPHTAPGMTPVATGTLSVI